LTPTSIYTASGIMNADLLRVRRLGLVLGDNARGMLSDVSRFPPKSHHLSDRILTLSCLLFCVILCEPVNLILDFVGIYVRYHENGA